MGRETQQRAGPWLISEILEYCLGKTKVIPQAMMKFRNFHFPMQESKFKYLWDYWITGGLSSLIWLSYYDPYIVCIGEVQYGTRLTSILWHLFEPNKQCPLGH